MDSIPLQLKSKMNSSFLILISVWGSLPQQQEVIRHLEYKEIQPQTQVVASQGRREWREPWNQKDPSKYPGLRSQVRKIPDNLKTASSLVVTVRMQDWPQVQAEINSYSVVEAGLQSHHS